MAWFSKRALVLFFLLGRALSAADLELVLTVPVETNLKVPGVPDTLPTWLDMIAQAKSPKGSLDIEQFYISNQAGEPMEPVLTAIRQAAASGAAVRLIVDKTFLKNEPSGSTILANTRNIEVRVIDYTKIGGVQHSKFFIVNQTDAYFGSANFDWRALKHIHETGIRTQNPHVVESLRSIFERDWAQAKPVGTSRLPARAARALKIPAAKQTRFTASPTKDIPARVDSTLKTLLGLIAGAKKTIRIQTMEYTTSVYGSGENWSELQDALIEAAKTKQVQLMVDKSKAGKPGLVELVKAGVQVRSVEIPEHSGGPIKFARLIHSKYAVADSNKFWLGTDNLGKGYFYQSRGVGVVSSDPQVADQLDEIFQGLWNSRYATGL